MRKKIRALLSAVPVPDPAEERKREAGRIRMEGEVPSPVNPAPGCRFRGRCPWRTSVCKKTIPPLQDMGGGHFAACHNLRGIKNCGENS